MSPLRVKILVERQPPPVNQPARAQLPVHARQNLRKDLTGNPTPTQPEANSWLLNLSNLVVTESPHEPVNQARKICRLMILHLLPNLSSGRSATANFECSSTIKHRELNRRGGLNLGREDDATNHVCFVYVS
jgi:hypothetical protein